MSKTTDTQPIDEAALAQIEKRAEAANAGSLMMPRIVSGSSLAADLTAEQLAAHEPLPIPFDVPTVEFVRHAKCDVFATTATIRALWAKVDEMSERLLASTNQNRDLLARLVEVEADCARFSALADKRHDELWVARRQRDSLAANHAGYARDLVAAMRDKCVAILKRWCKCGPRIHCSFCSVGKEIESLTLDQPVEKLETKE